jgi:hypothetical protein
VVYAGQLSTEDLKEKCCMMGIANHQEPGFCEKKTIPQIFVVYVGFIKRKKILALVS